MGPVLEASVRQEVVASPPPRPTTSGSPNASPPSSGSTTAGPRAGGRRTPRRLDPPGRPVAPHLPQQGAGRTLHLALPGRPGQPPTRPGRATQAGDRHGRASTTPSRSALGRGDLRRDLLGLGASRTCSTGSAPATTRSPASSGRPTRRSRRSSSGSYRRHKREAGPTTRRYFVDACHPVWGVDLLYSCWLLVGQRFLVGMGSGRKRLNILGAYCPDDHEYLDLRLTQGQHQRRAVRQPAASCCGRSTPRRRSSSSTWTMPGTTASRW